MNNISDNKYLVGRVKPLKEFSLRSYLHGEPVAPRITEKADDIFRLCCSMLFALGFKYYHPGTDYLASIVSRYIVKANFDFDSDLSDVARAYGTSEKNVEINILGTFKENDKLIPSAEKLLDTKLKPDELSTVFDLTELLGACFKLYYNYNSNGEDLYLDGYPLPNYSEFGICYGKSRKKD